MTPVAKKKSETEIEWLAGVLAQNFASIDSRFDQIDAKFEKIDGRFDIVENRLDRAEIKSTTIEIAVQTLTKKFDLLKIEVHGINDRIDSIIAPTAIDHEQRITKLELLTA
jgi:hypothetical protein